MARKAIIVLFALAFILAACSSGVASGKFEITDLWARPGNSGGNSAVYMLISNGLGEDDVLLMASSPVAGAVELHESMMMGEGQMSMMPQENIPAPANATVELKPGGLHVMLIGLQQDLAPGDTIDLTLTFENAGEMQFSVPVREP